MLDLQILLIFMIIAAVVAVEIKDMLGSVVAVGAIGLGLSMCFLLLQAPDLAIVQLVVEILSLVILIRAVGIKNGVSAVKKRKIFSIVSVLLFIGLFIYFSTKALIELPSFGNPIMRVAERYLISGIRETGAANLVSAIILDYRAFDTLGEATVLFTAVIGVLAVIRRVGRKSK